MLGNRRKTGQWRVNPLCNLRLAVNNSLKRAMNPLALTLILTSSAPVPANAPRLERVATASVTIVAAEEIRFGPDARGIPASRARQQRLRDGVQLVEFY